jgi:septin family protein
MTILMMNILVGILGANYERYEEQSQVLFVRERARMINILSTRPWLRHVWKKWGDEDFLYFATKATPNTEDERSTRRAMQISNEEALRQQSASLEAAFAEQVRKETESIREQNESLRQQNESMRKQLEWIVNALERSEQGRKQTESLEATFDQLSKAQKPEQPAELSSTNSTKCTFAI